MRMKRRNLGSFGHVRVPESMESGKKDSLVVGRYWCANSREDAVTGVYRAPPGCVIRGSEELWNGVPKYSFFPIMHYIWVMTNGVSCSVSRLSPIDQSIRFPTNDQITNVASSKKLMSYTQTGPGYFQLVFWGKVASQRR